MIGHFLLTLTPEQEDRVLTVPMGACSSNGPEKGCLVETAWELTGWWFSYGKVSTAEFKTWEDVGAKYDALCNRFGIARIGAAIRHRILANRARRTLATPRLAEVSEQFGASR